MPVKEIIYTKKECFTVTTDEHILCQKGKFTPSLPHVYDVRPLPPRPEESKYDLVQHNIWGEEIYRENEAIREWRIKCEAIKDLNEVDRKKQVKEFYRHVKEIKGLYAKQQKEIKKQQKIAKKELLLKKRRLNEVKRRSARAYLIRRYTLQGIYTR